MTPDELRSLWARYLAGEDLLLDDQKALVQALESDPALRAELLDDVELDGVLRSLGAVRRGGEGFVQTLAGSIDRERDATRFVKKVELRLADGPRPPSKRDTTRAFAIRAASRRYMRPGSSGAGWKAALAAAGVFLAVLLFAAASSRSGARPPKPVDNEARRNPSPPPPPPVPNEPAEETRIRLRLEQIEREQERLKQAPVPPEESADERRRRLDTLEEERLRIEAEMQRMIEEHRRRPSVPAPVPSDPAAPAPPATRAERLIAVEDGLRIEQVSGPAYLTPSKLPVIAGQDLPSGQGLYTYSNVKVTLRYADRTRVEVQSATEVRNQSDDKARRLLVLRGTIASDIEPQRPGRPMVFETPTAEARILGTSIRLAVVPAKDKNRDAETTLEVTKGKVELKRLSDGAVTEVVEGQFAIAAAAVDLKPRKAFPALVRIDFGPADQPTLPGWLRDSGEVYDPARGYGWDGAKDGRFIAEWQNPGRGSETRVHGRMTAVRAAGLKPEDWPKATSVIAGWGEASETWRMEVPNGSYKVTVCVGDHTFEQGPHVVSVNGRPVWPVPPLTKPGRHSFVEDEVIVDVKNGELRMTVGGLATKPSDDGSLDTILNFIVIERMSK